MKNLTPFAVGVLIFKVSSASCIGTLTYLVNRDDGKSRSDALVQALKCIARIMK